MSSQESVVLNCESCLLLWLWFSRYVVNPERECIPSTGRRKGGEEEAVWDSLSITEEGRRYKEIQSERKREWGRSWMLVGGGGGSACHTMDPRLG